MGLPLSHRLKSFSTGASSVECRLYGSDQLMAIGFNAAFEAVHHGAVPAHQELLEVPGNRSSGLGLGEGVKRRAAGSHLVHQLKGDAVGGAAEGLDLLQAAWLLAAEVIAGKADHLEALAAVALLQLLQAGVLAREAAAAGHVHD